MSPDLLTKVILPLSLFLIMFGMGLSLTIANFREVFKAPKAVTIGLIGQLLLLPAVAFIIALIMKLPAEIAAGLMIIALAPGGATSNMFTYLSKGDTSLSVSLTAIVSVITPFTIPITAAFFMAYFMGTSSEFSIPVIQTIIKLLGITIVPVAIGMLVFARWPNMAKAIEGKLKVLSIVFLLLIIILIVMKNIDQMGYFFAQAGLATLFLNIITLLIGYKMATWGKLSVPQATAIGFEVGIQNGTLALVVTGTLIGNEVMMIPAVTYALIMFFTGGAFALWIKRKHTV
ncbi:MAG: bile acid:Na+ symporter, BASS family [Thiomicrorhabdus sp.]|nr:MAG: bile acid:Na+ symporter, BASS family [Thiomicrorhabdus sp.]